LLDAVPELNFLLWRVVPSSLINMPENLQLLAVLEIAARPTQVEALEPFPEFHQVDGA